MITVGNNFNIACVTAQVTFAAPPNPIREALFIRSSQSVATADSKVNDYRLKVDSFEGRMKFD